MDDRSFSKRIKAIKPSQVDPDWPGFLEIIDPDPKPRWRLGVSKATRTAKLGEWLATLPYAKRLAFCYRPDECPVDLHTAIWDEVNAHLGTTARSLAELVEQLGIMRFGHRPRAADHFAGGGSIPFEAARIGCDSEGSDLNPIACMLTWGALNVIGGDNERRTTIAIAQSEVVKAIEGELETLGVEWDREGRQAKAYLYCVEVRCPKTGYLVPVAPSWVISRNQRVIAKLTPRPERKDYDISIVTNASVEEMAEAEHGTLVGDAVIHPANPNREGVAMSVIRGDHRTHDGGSSNHLRHWLREDVVPSEHDRFGERLYCIQWLKPEEDIASGDAEEASDEAEEEIEDDGRSTFFAAPTEHDLANEAKVLELVRSCLGAWQDAGQIPSGRIVTGDKTDEPIRTRGWTHWHHLFTPRHLLFGAIALKKIREIDDPTARGALLIGFCLYCHMSQRSVSVLWLNRTNSSR